MRSTNERRVPPSRVDRLALCLMLISAVSISCNSWRGVKPHEMDPVAEDPQSRPDTIVTVSGQYVCGQGFSYLYPNGSQEVWCVLGGGMCDRYSRIATSAGEKLEVKLSGWTKAVPGYSADRACDREFLVTEILEMRKEVTRY